MGGKNHESHCTKIVPKHNVPAHDGKQKNKKFRPFSVPRYLPGEVPENVLKSDLKAYNNHRYQIFTAKPKVDSSPPKMNPYSYVDAKRLAEDAARLRRIDDENKQLLKKINIINRHGGKVDSYNTKVIDRGASKWFEHERECLGIVKHNKVIYTRIMKAQSSYRKEELDKFWNQMLKKLTFQCRYPLTILEKPNIDLALRRLPSVSEEIGGFYRYRPLCFLTFKIDNGIVLGTIIVELYSDVVPVTVQNFISLIKGTSEGLTYKNSIIHNIVKCYYCELGDVTHGNGKGGISIYGEKFSEENFNLKHTRPGVLSMIPIGNNENNSQFSITFTAMPKFDKKRVVFGKVVKGFETMMKIDDVGKKVGKPNPAVRIVNCGECSEKMRKKLKKMFKEHH